MYELAYGARIGISSLRRKIQLKKYGDDFLMVDLRGNIEGRLEKLDNGDFDVVVITAAGLICLGLENRIFQRTHILLQGALAIVVRS